MPLRRMCSDCAMGQHAHCRRDWTHKTRGDDGIEILYVRCSCACQWPKRKAAAPAIPVASPHLPMPLEETEGPKYD